MVHVSTLVVLLLVASTVLTVAAKRRDAGAKKHHGKHDSESHCKADGECNKRFVIEDKMIGGVLNAKVLLNTQTGERAEIVVDYGGRVEDLVLASRSNNKLWPVLQTHDGDAEAIIENVWSMGMLLIPWANRIAYGKYTFFNETYQLPLNEDTTERQNNMHGLMAGAVMEVRSTTVSDESAQLVLGFQTDGTDEGYPFRFDLEVTYVLDSTSEFYLDFRITNLMESDPLPLYVGWHPYFVCTAYSTYVILDQCTGWNHVELNENMNPTGITAEFHGFDGSDPIGGSNTSPTFYDDEYKPRAGIPTREDEDCATLETQLVDTATDHTVNLWQDANFRFVHIFTGKDGAIAMEPMSGMADAFNNHDHLTVLSGGEVWLGSFGITVDSYE